MSRQKNSNEDCVVQGNPSPKWLANMLMVATLLSLLTVFVSSYIRIVESGAGCEMWPSCYGQYHANESAQGLNVLLSGGEQSPNRTARVLHRLVTTILGVIILTIFIFSRRLNYRKTLGQAEPALLLILTLILASVGSIHPNQPIPLLILINFLGGLALVKLTFSLYLRVTRKQKEYFTLTAGASPGFIRALKIGILVISLQILMGGLASANYTGASCSGLFQCNEIAANNLFIDSLNEPNKNTMVENIPFMGSLALDQNMKVIPFANMKLIQFVHHILALVGLCYFLFLLRLSKNSEKKLHKDCMSLTGLLIIQLLLGLSALEFQLPVAIVVLHNFVAAVMIMFATSLNQKLS